jgi:Uncharacterised protein family (UPF0259)
MYMKPTAPRSVGGVFEDAIRLYRNLGSSAWLLALALELATAVPSLAWQVHLMPAVADGMQDPLTALENPLAAVHVPTAVWLLTLIAIPIYMIFYVALIAHINGVVSGQAVSARNAIGLGIGRLPSALSLGVLIVCIVILGIVLLLVPGFYWAGTLSLAFIALVVEGAGVSQSMAVSRGLVKDHWWHAAIVISYNFVIAAVAYLAVLLITGLVAVVLGAGGSSTVLISGILSVAAGTLLSPLYCAVSLALYYDLRLRKDNAGSLD